MKKNRRSFPNLPARLVVGVDESGLSDHAVRQALELGRRLSARVRLVHAVPTPPDVWPGIDPVRGEELTTELIAGARRVINERVRPVVRASNPGKSAPTGLGAATTAVVDAPPGTDPVEVFPGQPAKVLLDQVRERASDWIVLGAHGKRGLLDFGNTLRAVFAKATVPVWVQSHAVRPIARILAPVDLSEESLDALAMARDVAQALHASLHVLHCFDLGSYAIAGAFDNSGYGATFPFEEVRKSARARFDDAMREFDWQSVEHSVEFAEGAPVDRILGHADAADLIVLGTHGQTGLASVLLGGTTYSVLKRSELPVLVARRVDRSFLL